MAALTLIPGKTTLNELRTAYCADTSVRLIRNVRDAVEASARRVQEAAMGDKPVYGVNTGFGKLVAVKIAAQDTTTLQRNLVLSHSSGVGPQTPPQITRLMMVLKLLSLGRGASGVRWALIELIEEMVNRGVLPVVPIQGSVGASGDLAPLAHMAAVMIGEGEAIYKDRALPGTAALAEADLEPIVLTAKEGLALINGTQFSNAYAMAALVEAWHNAEAAVVTSCLSTDAMMASTAPLHPEIHELRGHSGQIDVARAMRDLMSGSEIRESHLEGDSRVQDAYCIRCQAQVAGACVDLLRQASRTLTIEANAVTDNPLVLQSSGDILSGGNFHAEPIAFAADQIALALAELGSIAQRRIALMVDPTLSCDLPPFLASNPGLNSGFMSAEITSAALMSENKHLANPCSTDSTPTSANQEDHVSMSAHGARRLAQMNANLSNILGIELLCAAQGIEFRSPLLTSAPLKRVIEQLREEVSTLGGDRPLAPDLERASKLVTTGKLANATGISPLLGIEDMA